MSAKEQLQIRINDLTEAQIRAVLDLINSMLPNQTNQDLENEIDSVMGMLHKYADPDLIPHEKEAWAEAAAEKEKNFKENYFDETA